MRPSGLTAVCVICLVMGALGCFPLLFGCIGLVAQPMINEVTQDFVRGMAGNSPQVQQQLDQQESMMQEVMAIQREWMPYSIAAMVFLAVAVVGMIVGAILGLNLKRMAHVWMITGMVAAIAHGLIGGYVGYTIQRDSQAIVMRNMNQAMQAGPAPAPPAAKAMANSAMQAGQAVGLMFMVFWLLVKCGTYGTCSWYLLTPKIRQLFEGDGSERAVIDALSEPPT